MPGQATVLRAAIKRLPVERKRPEKIRLLPHLPAGIGTCAHGKAMGEDCEKCKMILEKLARSALTG